MLAAYFLIPSVSLFYLIGLFDLWAGLRALLISSVGAYVIAAKIHGPYMPWVGFVFLMGHLSINHLSRQSRGDPGVIDITGAQMVLVMKLSAFCWNVHDGRLPQEGLSDFQKERSIRQLPSLLDYAGYVFFFPSLFAGPSFDYVEYHRWIETTMFEVPPGTDASKHPPTRKKRRIPRSRTPATLKAMAGLLWIFTFIKLSGWYNTELLTGDQFLTYSFPYRLWLLHMFGVSSRTKYYGVWALTEGACILSGLGYKGIDPTTGRVQWNRLQNVNPLGVETAQNTRAYLENWNINTNHWLRNYVYLRVTPKGKKPGFRASLATFTTSAFWHGFYPGYYLSFILASFLQTVAKNFRRHVRPLFLTPSGSGAPTTTKRIYDILSFFCTQLAFSFAVAPFILLTFPASFKVWSRVYFYCPIGVMLSMAFFASPAKQYLIRLQERRTGVGGTGAGVGGVDGVDGTGPGIDQKKGGNRPLMPSRNISHEDSTRRTTVMGVPSDPGRELDEMMAEVKAEVKARNWTGGGG
ncbi:MAG: hypothetical protein M1823_006284, partial [Watsoniomyces obsoletus]